MVQKDLILSITDKLTCAGLSIALAETSTGGLIADRITNQAGASAYFMGSIVAYSYESLRALLAVKPETLDKHGAVSEATVIEMAQNVRRLFSADIGLAICGISGPSGGTALKPVGTTWLAIADAENIFTVNPTFIGMRNEIKAKMADHALVNLQSFLQSFYR